jgi:hypothetical protein
MEKEPSEAVVTGLLLSVTETAALLVDAAIPGPA